MAKIVRKNQKIFGSSAGAAQLGKFGSLAAGSAATTTDPEEVQSLSNYLVGWYGAVIGGNAPCIEDMNGLCFLFAYQLAYLFQAGIPEWNAQTSYYIGSLVNSSGQIYISKTDDNLNNAVTDSANWQLQGGGVTTQTADYGVQLTDELIRINNTGSAQVTTLPAIATVPIGKEYVIKRVYTSTYQVTVQANGAELIDGANTFVLTSAKNALRIKANGTSWDVV